MSRIKFLFSLFICLLTFPAAAQTVALSDQASVSVLTCGVGNEVYSLFGHTGIRIKDPEKNIDIVYNYGAFDFEAPNFTLKFVKGDLQYFVTAGTFEDFLIQYQMENRTVSEQVLNIPSDLKQNLFDNLNKVMFSDERFYTYKFIDRNCTNMAVDIINKTLGEKIIIKVMNTEPTYRETLYPYFDGHFYEQLGTSIIFGTKVDQQATFLFLPVELEQSLEKVKYKDEKLAENKVSLVETNKKELPGSWWNNFYTYLLFLALIVIVNKDIITISYLVIVSLIGVFFSIAGLYSLHEELAYNYNIMLFNPLLLLLVYFYYTKNAKWLYRSSLICIVVIGAYLIVIMNKIHLFIVMPIVITNLIILWRFSQKAQSKKKTV